MEGETAYAVAESCADDEVDVASDLDVRRAVDGIAGLKIAAHGDADGVDCLVALNACQSAAGGLEDPLDIVDL